MPTIPLEDTFLISEGEDPSNIVMGLDGANPVTLHSDDVCYFLRPTTIPGDIPNQIPEYTAGDISLTWAQLSNMLGRAIGRTVEWQPNTDFYGPHVYNGINLPPDIVSWNGELFITLSDFTSGASFNETSVNDLVLSRITLDQDDDYVEIIANATSPILANSIISRYAPIRKLDVFRFYNLPNSRLQVDDTDYHVARCNGNISTPLVISLKRVFDNGESTIGTITFTPEVGKTVIDGVIVFNDPAAGPDPTVLMHFGFTEMLFFEATTIPIDFEWVSITLLGVMRNYRSYQAPQ